MRGCLAEGEGVEVGFGGFPVVGDFPEDGGDEAAATLWGWEDGHDAGSTADLLVKGYAEVGGAEAFADGIWEGEEGEAFGEVAGDSSLAKAILSTMIR